MMNTMDRSGQVGWYARFEASSRRHLGGHLLRGQTVGKGRLHRAQPAASRWRAAGRRECYGTGLSCAEVVCWPSACKCARPAPVR